MQHSKWTELLIMYTLMDSFFCDLKSRQLSVAKEGFTEASLGLLANQRRRHLLTGLLKSLRTIKTLVRFTHKWQNI